VALRSLRRALSISVVALVIVIAALAGALFVSVHGYRALTREEVAALVSTAPAGEQSFVVSVALPDGRLETFRLAGDELYVDAHILKWKPIANLAGLHTAYELDRVAGRYRELDDERSRPRTVFSLGAARPFDLFDLRRRFAALAPLVDAEYGSATFIAADVPALYELRVSTSGLLVRRLETDG
jgi:hypothetical protein